ncbi:aldo/keto reductase [Acinetobacter sp. A47]|uniref:aldo/keto reductase n=1 Tax=Acinetobacter sp. A47 TaxID=1561217 RepID=UPI0005713078|nr:aldo/keto reductase [Acinetobacter sp. A47]
MKYRYLGRTGLKVSELCLGTLMLGSWGKNNYESSELIIKKALNKGINYFDTADSYSNGESEKILGESLKKLKKRDNVIIATKVNTPMGADPNSRGSSRRWITKAVEDSLKRLQTDWIDIYQLHRPDPFTDIEETLSVLNDLVKQGKIRYFGTSTFPVSSLVEAQHITKDFNVISPSIEQPPYSILAREIENEVLPICSKYKIGVAVWSPLAGGWLSGKIKNAADVITDRTKYWGNRYDMSQAKNQKKLEIVLRLNKICEEFNISLNHLAIAFTLNHPAVTSAIIGPRTLDHLDTLVDAVNLNLSVEILDMIDTVVEAGITVSEDDKGYISPAILNPSLRRR